MPDGGITDSIEYEDDFQGSGVVPDGGITDSIEYEDDIQGSGVVPGSISDSSILDDFNSRNAHDAGNNIRSNIVGSKYGPRVRGEDSINDDSADAMFEAETLCNDDTCDS